MSTLRTHLKKILEGRHHDPFAVLGPHVNDDGENIIRAFLPEAVSAWAVHGNKSTQMQALGTHGFYECLNPNQQNPANYKIKIQAEDGNTWMSHDPYSFAPVLSDFDLHLMGEGTHYNKYEKLGAHIKTINKIKGIHFAVWAPNAKGVSVVGNFNHWRGKRHPMRIRGEIGIWEIFIPKLSQGEVYKFELQTHKGMLLKTDPYGFYAEMRPATASIVWDINKYKWDDSKWMKARKQTDWLKSNICTYELHLGSWMKKNGKDFLSYKELAHGIVQYAKNMGYSHIEVLPIQEHPLDASWGYQTIGYFSVTSRFGNPDDFMYFVDHCHQNDIGVIIDWVPAHFPKDSHGLAEFDGTYLYEHDHPFQREHMDWGTHIFNYGRNEVASFLLNSALFWLNKYHIDGLRVDAVASMLYLDYSREDGEWIPNKYGGNENIEAIEFIKRFNELCHKHHPGVLTIAEESTAWPMVSRPTYAGGLGFSLKWNMGWMHDILEYFQEDPIHRKYHHHSLTFSMIYAFNENFVLVLSHDEVVHGKRSMLDKMPGDTWQKFANLRLLYGFMCAHPGKKMLFMGGEIGQWSEWSEDASIDWHLLRYEPHAKLQSYVQDINMLTMNEPSLHELDFDPAGFQWIDYSDAEASVISFIRRGINAEDFLIFVFNFTPIVRENYRIGAPKGGVYQEIINSDSDSYGGSNVGNSGTIHAEKKKFNAWDFSLSLTLPPLGMLVLKLTKKKT